MRSAWIGLATLLPLVAGCTEPAPEVAAAISVSARKGAAESGPIGCSITGDSTCELGKAPKITVALTNRTHADIYLVGSLDASDRKWRHPHCYFEVTGPGGQPADRRTLRCGNMNTLRQKDFVKVRPGEAFDPYQHVDDYGFFSTDQLGPGTFQAAGEYQIRFVYSTKSDTIAEWGGDGRDRVAADATLVRLFRHVPKVEIRSNVIKVKVVEPGK